MANQNDFRIGDADQDAAAARLREHFAAGRLTLDEFQDRLATVFSAATRRDLSQVTADLPHDGATPGTMAPPWAGSGRSRSGPPRPGRYGRASAPWGRPGRPPGRRRRRFRSRLLVACAVVALLCLLVGSSVHGLLAVIFFVMLGLIGIALGVTAGLIWLGVRWWRRAGGLDALPVAVAAPWLGRAIWAGRAARAGHRARSSRAAWSDRGVWSDRAGWPGSTR